MKINFILPTVDQSGGNRVVAIHALLLQQKGHEVTVISVPPKNPTWLQKFYSILIGKKWISNHRPNPSYFDKIPVNHIIIDKNRSITSNDVPDADVTIATWWETAEWVNNFPLSKGTHFYFIQHYEVFDYLPQARVKATWRLPFKKIVVAPWLEEIARKKYGDNDVKIVPNAVDPALFNANLRNKQVTPTIGMLYAPIYWKGTDIAIKAIHIARQKIPELKIIAFGSHNQSPDCKLPEGTLYFYMPKQEKIKEIYSQCDAWLFPSRSEGFGLPILEAMACRTPVIGVPTGAAPELLSANTGVLVEPENPKAMAQAIIDVCELSEGEWQQLSKRAYQRATSYQWTDASLIFEKALTS
jgi:glycosyltransferase involved in cell wall biosynthesis